MSTGTLSKVEQTSMALIKELESSPAAMKVQVMRNTLESIVEKIREVLPDKMKDQADRLIKRALITFGAKAELLECTPASFVRCVLQAAELGLAIDGKLCHAVKFNNKYQEDGKDVWRKEAVCMPDFKGLVACAKRSGTIIDIYGDVICEHDHWVFMRGGNTDVLEHTFDLKKPRGAVIGCYVKIILPYGGWRAEVMTRADIDHIMGKSKTKDFGPWKSDYSEMARKSVVRRALKMYADDPGVSSVLAVMEDFEFKSTGIDQATLATGISMEQSRSAQLAQQMAAKRVTQQTTPAELIIPHGVQTEQREEDPLPQEPAGKKTTKQKPKAKKVEPDREPVGDHGPSGEESQEQSATAGEAYLRDGLDGLPKCNDEASIDMQDEYIIQRLETDQQRDQYRMASDERRNLVRERKASGVKKPTTLM